MNDEMNHMRVITMRHIIIALVVLLGVSLTASAEDVRLQLIAEEDDAALVSIVDRIDEPSARLRDQIAHLAELRQLRGFHTILLAAEPVFHSIHGGAATRRKQDKKHRQMCQFHFASPSASSFISIRLRYELLASVFS